MIHKLIGYSVLAALVPAGLGSSQAIASEAAAQPGPRTLQGTVVAVDRASGEMKLAWRHRGASELEIVVKLAPDAEVRIGETPAKPADLKPGDRVTVTGEARGTDRDNHFLVSRVAVEPVTASGGPDTAPAPADVDPEVNRILDRLESKGGQIKDIETPIRFTKIDPVLEDKQVFQGLLRYKEDQPNPRFFIRFDKFTQEGITREQPEWHLFDGQWYIEARQRTNTIVKRQIVRPGEEINVFRIGQGPFPLPFGQKKAEILKYFDVKLLPPAQGDPAGSVHLECTPKPGTDMADKYGSVHFYVDRRLDLPVTVRTVEKSENVEVMAEFPADKIRINIGMAAGHLDLPELKGFQIDTVPLPAPDRR